MASPCGIGLPYTPPMAFSSRAEAFFFFASEKAGAIAAGKLAHFVATTLPNIFIRVLRLRDRTF
jgi:hypothetical protein